jgi:5-aminopentanamidase
LIVGTLDHQSILDARAANHYLQDRRPELYGPLHKP